MEIIELEVTLDSLISELVKTVEMIQTINSENLSVSSKEAASYATLAYILDKAAELGFIIKNVTKGVGYIQYGEGAESDDYIGIFGNVGTNAKTVNHVTNSLPTFTDNTSAMITNLFSLYALKQLKITFDVPVRIIFPIDKDGEFEHIKDYLRLEVVPLFGWTPTSTWCVTYPTYQQAKIRIQSKHSKESTNHQDTGSIREILDLTMRNHKSLETDVPIYGINITKIYEAKDHMNVEISYPETIKSNDLKVFIETNMLENQVYTFHSMPQHVVESMHSHYIEPLTQSYAQVTGERIEPRKADMLTYASLIQNTVGFGPRLIRRSEYMDTKDTRELLRRNMEIYTRSLLMLSGIVEST
ncbi:M20 family metallopeptidase [Erysipelothrix anatis]|uniref:M20 family metallopeptidase n=1 Tax=Erysipelothrix anatis TaxID=2683713 RepID=UPI00140D74DE|nr:M20 family metallopeptidase [Erysipelothrix anatis]